MMKSLTLIFATSIAFGSSAMAQNNEEAPAGAERAKRGEGEDADARAALKEKLGALVEAGKITRDDAGDLYRTAFPERSRARRQYRNKRVAEVKAPELFNKDVKNPIFSGPQPGERLVSFKSTGLAGEHKEQVLDPIAMASNGSQIIVFQDDSGASIRGLNNLSDSIGKIDRKSEIDLHVSVVFLSDDPEAIKKYAGIFPALIERGVDVVAFSKEGREGPGAYGLNRTVSQTFLLAKGGTVLHNFVLPQGGLYSDPHVLGGIAELIGEKRETVQAWLNQETTRGREMRRR